MKKEKNTDAVREDEVSKKISFGKVLLIVAIVAFLAIILFALKSCNDSNKKPVVDDEKFPVFYYKNDNNAYIIPSGKTDARKIGKIDDIESSNDGDIVFFVWDNDLFYHRCDNKTPKGKNATDYGIKIAEDILSFDATGDGRFVLYTTPADELYLSDKKKSRHIFDNVSSFSFSEDENLIRITDNNGDEYISGLGKNDVAEKIDLDIDDLYTTNSYKDIYYTKRGDLYHKSGKKSAKILNDVVKILKPRENCLFAVTTNFDDESLNVTLYKLDGKKAKKIESELSGISCFSRDWLLKKADSAEDEYIVLKSNGSTVSVNLENKSDFYLTENEKYIYCIENKDDSGKGIFVRYTLTDKGLSSKKELFQNTKTFTFSEDEDYILIRGDETGIYKDDNYYKLSDNTVYFANVTDGDKVYFIDDYINGTLMMFDNGKMTEIDTNVRSIRVKGEHLYYIKGTDLYYKKGNGEEIVIDTDVGNFDYMPPSCY